MFNKLNFHSDAARVLQLRGKAMQESVEKIETKMVAVIGLDIFDIENQLKNLEIGQNEVCEIANDTGQIILSGTKRLLKNSLIY